MPRWGGEKERLQKLLAAPIPDDEVCTRIRLARNKGLSMNKLLRLFVLIPFLLPAVAESQDKKNPFELKKGDRVLASKYGGTEIKLDGKEYKILSSDDVLAVLE